MSLEPSRQFRFERTINLGHVLTAISMIATLVVSASYFDRRMTIIEMRQTFSDKAIEILSSQNKTMGESQNTITKSLERITTILEERAKK
jgi:uncharacterized coiled-coil protein SlyX